MREIKFRGKRKDNGEWVEGNYTHNFRKGECHYISNFDDNIDHEVDPETVGQFTDHEQGLYEGDIVNYLTGNPSRYVNCVIRYGGYQTYTKVTYLNDTDYNEDAGDVEEHLGFYLDDGKLKIPLGGVWIEKVGNIHDNPELLNQ